MKYFNALTAVENQIIRLGELRNLFAVITNGFDGSTREQIESAVHYIEGSIDDISVQLSDQFQVLFDQIANSEKGD